MFRTLAAFITAAAVVSAGPIQKRTTGRATYYLVGQGACGQYNVPSDFIVAMNEPQYGSGYPSPNCFRQITIHAEGKTATATVMDLCPNGYCSYGDIDMSQGLFEYFHSTDVGAFQVDWEWSDGAAPGPAPQQPPPAAVNPPPANPQPDTTTWVVPPTTTSSSVTNEETLGVQNVAPPPPSHVGGSYVRLGNTNALAKAVVNMGNIIRQGAVGQSSSATSSTESPAAAPSP